jgi:hypothetical protein
MILGGMWNGLCGRCGGVGWIRLDVGCEDGIDICSCCCRGAWQWLGVLVVFMVEINFLSILDIVPTLVLVCVGEWAAGIMSGVTWLWPAICALSIRVPANYSIYSRWRN